MSESFFQHRDCILPEIKNDVKSGLILSCKPSFWHFQGRTSPRSRHPRRIICSVYTRPGRENITPQASRIEPSALLYQTAAAKSTWAQIKFHSRPETIENGTFTENRFTFLVDKGSRPGYPSFFLLPPEKNLDKITNIWYSINSKH